MSTAVDCSTKRLEKELKESVNNKDIENVRRLLAEGVAVDCLDDDGMTPLQHAAYKADLEMCELLLKHGANVNANFHNHGYTALMFAALSGDKRVRIRTLHTLRAEFLFDICFPLLFYMYKK